MPAKGAIPLEDALLSDGTVVSIRPVTPADAVELKALYERASREALRLRFFTYSSRLGGQDVDRMLRLADREHVALVATDSSGAVGVASLNRSGPPDSAEFALLVDDARHGQGVGTLLIEHVVAAARRLGYTRLHADVLSENREMLHVLRNLGVHPTMHSEGGVVDVDFVLPAHRDWQLAVQTREAVSEYASLNRVLAPRSIAVVGAGRRATSVGRRIVVNLLSGGFAGELYVVNPTASSVEGVTAYGSLRDLPVTPDLVVVAVPATQVLGVIDEAALVGAYGLVVVSDGFAELGDIGRDLQRRILGAVRGGGMRMIGPNCLGLANFDSDVRMNATFADISCPAGSVGVASQSGGVALALIDAMGRRGIGVSTFVSMGNKADVSGNDMLQYWSRDDATNACLLYLESFGNARKFAQIARQVARTKPVVAITAGRSTAGARGVRSHTAAAATPDVAIDALFRQAGVIGAATLTEALDVISVINAGPMPQGPRVGVVSNGGGPAALTADACTAVNLEMPEFSRALRERLAALLSPHAATSNPVDTTAGGGPVELAQCARVMAESGEVDSVIVVHASLDATDRDAVAAALAEMDSTCPVLAVFLGGLSTPESLLPSSGARTSCFAYPEEAARALSKVTTYSQWRQRVPAVRVVGRSFPKVRKLAVDLLAAQPKGDGWLDTDAAAELLVAARIPVISTCRVGSERDAVVAASKAGYPVVVKAAGGAILHRTELGGVFVGVRSAKGVRSAVRAIHDRWGSDCPIVVQPMASSGIEMAVGMLQDPTVGPVVMVAMGGVATDLQADRSFSLPPLTLAESKAQIGALRGAPLLSGYRGAPKCNLRALADILRRVGDLALAVPEIAELDLNPVIVSPSGAMAVDVKLRLSPDESVDPYLRSLKPRPRSH